MAESKSFNIEFISIPDAINVTIEGVLKNTAGQTPKIIVGSNTYEFQISTSLQAGLYATVPLRALLDNSLKIEASGEQLELRTDKFSGFTHQFSGRAYRLLEDNILQINNGQLTAEPYSRFRHFWLEYGYLFRLLISRKKAVFYRLLYWLIKPLLSRKKYWLFSDRPFTAGDNADYLFRYVAQQNDLPKGVVPVFAINKSHASYQKLKEYGRVIPFGGIRYILLALLAQKRISSQFDEYIINPLGGGDYCNDLCRFEYIYLEHGVLTSDSSGSFGRRVRNASLITAAAAKEQKAIFTNKDYGYGDSVVRLTGHARFDGLVSKPQRKIIFMPTWREALAGDSTKSRGNTRKGFRAYSPDFKATGYYKFYDSLLTDDALLKALNQYDYDVEFYVHPSFAAQWSDFTASQRVKIMQPPHNYELALTQGSLMVTDYSGVAFDFAYMKKPVIYTQFDKDNFYQNHYYQKGYFSFENDGFGSVVVSRHEAVENIISMLKNDCQMNAEYSHHAETFFYKIDQQNCKRIYDDIKREPL